MNVSKVQVLLSTYNGEKYLKEQLDSLLAQDYPNIDILIRDDGSKDSTKQILTGYENHKNIRVIYGSNIGITASFLELLKISDPEAEFLAFCDQDDVWLKDKISRAVAALQKHPSDIPLMYCSRLTIVDESLRIIGYSKLPRKGLSFNNAPVSYTHLDVYKRQPYNYALECISNSAFNIKVSEANLRELYVRMVSGNVLKPKVSVVMKS